MLKIDSNKKAKARKQAGFVVTAELLLITTILGLGLITGFTKVRDQVLAELSDTGSAIGAIDQSYRMVGTNWTVTNSDVAQVAGFAFEDSSDPNTNSAVGGDDNQVVYTNFGTPAIVGNGGEEGVQ